MERIITPVDNRNTKLDSFEKGCLFENYIIKLFNERYFKLVKWRKSQKVQDTFTLITHSYPDLELIFAGTKKYRFAVECKWRKEFIGGKINWASSYQTYSYEEFENRFHVPVFVAIGIGGEPWAPGKLFVTPLRNISRFTDVYESQLIPFKRKPTHSFFYDTVQLKLF